ncbi:MAG: Fic family protein [Aeropyrum sp.]|nr:Fic family protein [Aeropyrum sp.]
MRYPKLQFVERVVAKLRELYPRDPIGWKGGGREQVEQALEAARWAFHFTKDKPCYARKLAAAAALFTEIILLHPLTDGNKRLATLMLWIFLRVNRLPRPRRIAGAVIRVAGGEWGQEEVYQWLTKVYKAWRARRRVG